MPTRYPGRASIALTISIAIAGATAPLSAQSEPTRQITVVQEMAPVGLAAGQMLRYSWANPASPESLQHFEPLRVVVRLLAADGTVLAQDAAPAVGPGRFQVFDFRRGAIGEAGEPTTARVQVRVEATVVARSAAPNIVSQRGSFAFDAGVEIIDEATGATTVAMGHGFNELSLDDTAGKEKSARQGYRIISAGHDAFIGIVPGQSLRITAVSPTAGGRTSKPLFAFTVLDLDGRPLVEGDPVLLEPDRFYSFDVPYSALGASAGRVQVRTQARYFHGVVSHFPTGDAQPAPVVLEIVDAALGRTIVHLSQKPKEIVVVGSKIEP